MSKATRIGRIMDKLDVLWHKNPELRLCQLLHNIMEIHYDWYFVSDADLEACINQALKEADGE